MQIDVLDQELAEPTESDPTAAVELAWNLQELAGEITRLVAASLLEVLADAGARTEEPGPERPPASASVRRAIEFIVAHPDEPLTVGDIADVVNVTPRALQYGFKRHLGMGPMAYVRRVRLELAHQALRKAAGQDGASVREIAKQCGFGNPSRFAADYRAAYGQPPSHSLRSAPLHPAQSETSAFCPERAVS